MSSGFDAPASLISIRAGVGGVRKGQIVKLSSGKVIACSAQGEAGFGVAVHSADADGLTLVCVAGECDVEVNDAAADLPVGSYFTPTTAGVAEVATSSDFVHGIMLEAGEAAVGSTYAYKRCIVFAYKGNSVA